MKKILALCALCVLLIIPQTGCGKEAQVSQDAFMLDTDCTVTIYNIDKSKGEELCRQTIDLCKNYEKKLSKTVRGSDVDRINRAGGQTVTVGSDTVRLLRLGIEMSRRTDGLFDVTVGRLTDLWDFKSEHPKVPSAAKIRAAVKTVGYRNIHISGRRVRLSNPGTKIDLGAIAKGYIADRASEYLKKQGVEQAILNFGGNVVTIGSKDGGNPWNVGIERPFTDRSEVIGSTEVHEAAVVTSGIYERKFKVNGKLYHHIINPRTGYPIENDIEADTIVGPGDSSARCDALSTACLLLGSKKGRALVEQEDGYEALIIKRDDSILKTKGMNFTASDGEEK
ncbi:MAG: FAD:protein FMN transferase [Anaerovoracaceae bacterium]|jgi:thiamine biosynthesis lipoprotein